MYLVIDVKTFQRISYFFTTSNNPKISEHRVSQDMLIKFTLDSWNDINQEIPSLAHRNSL